MRCADGENRLCTSRSTNWPSRAQRGGADKKETGLAAASAAANVFTAAAINHNNCCCYYYWFHCYNSLAATTTDAAGLDRLLYQILDVIYIVLYFYIASRLRLQQSLDKRSAGSADSPSYTCFRLEVIYVYVKVHGMNIHMMAHSTLVIMIEKILQSVSPTSSTLALSSSNISVCLYIYIYV